MNQNTNIHKHQAAEREAELMEGRSRGMLTKAQTQGKYGW